MKTSVSYQTHYGSVGDTVLSPQSPSEMLSAKSSRRGPSSEAILKDIEPNELAKAIDRLHLIERL